MEFYQKLGPLM